MPTLVTNALSTLDVADGYDDALRALGHTVKAYNFHTTLLFYYHAINHWRRNFDKNFAPDPYMYRVFASDRLIIEAVAFVPDVVLIVNGLNLHRNAYEMLHNLCLPVALLLTESPYLDADQAIVMDVGHVAVAFTNDKSSVEPLAETSGVRTVYLPHSFNPNTHRPRPGISKYNNVYESDVFFHGTLWPDRVALLEPLFDLPYDVAISGVVPGGSEEEMTEEEKEEIADNIVGNTEMAFCYNGTKIAINHHRTFVGIDCEGEEIYIDGGAYSLGPRAFEIAACGTFQLCDDTRPELKEVFGESVGTYSSEENLLEQVVHFMEQDSKREEMAREALARVQNCSFEKRAEKILIPALMEV